MQMLGYKWHGSRQVITPVEGGEPITNSYPELGTGGGTQAVTKTPITDFKVTPVTPK